jgi:hypothetical protein
VKYKDKKHCFALVTADRVYHVCADDDNEMHLWVQAINRQRLNMNSQAQMNKSGSSGFAQTSANTGFSSQFNPGQQHIHSTPGMSSGSQPNGLPNQNGSAKEVAPHFISPISLPIRKISTFFF